MKLFMTLTQMLRRRIFPRRTWPFGGIIHWTLRKNQQKTSECKKKHLWFTWFSFQCVSRFTSFLVALPSFSRTCRRKRWRCRKRSRRSSWPRKRRLGSPMSPTGFSWWLISPIGSMYGIFNNIHPKNHPNVGKYTIHGSYGSWYIYSSWMFMGL